ncbi:hypothetical protein AAC387_Pa12g1021 [Persea americana]
MRSDPFSRDQGRFCAYHKQSGHRTDKCKSFKFHLENLVKDEHLRNYVKEEDRDNGQPPCRDDGGQDSELEAIINVIHFAPSPKGSSQARAEARRASHQKQVLNAVPEPAAKKAKREGPRTSFSDRDLENVELPHNDPLVLTLKL